MFVGEVFILFTLFVFVGGVLSYLRYLYL
jgi:hypothetical protein